MHHRRVGGEFQIIIDGMIVVIIDIGAKPIIDGIDLFPLGGLSGEGKLCHQFIHRCGQLRLLGGVCEIGVIIGKRNIRTLGIRNILYRQAYTAPAKPQGIAFGGIFGLFEGFFPQ